MKIKGKSLETEVQSPKSKVQDPSAPVEKVARRFEWLWRFIDRLRYGKRKP